MQRKAIRQSSDFYRSFWEFIDNVRKYEVSNTRPMTGSYKLR